MNKLISVLVLGSSMLLVSSSFAATGKSCSITCYEKTPDCYVTKDSSGCLIISNEKPKKNKKGDLMCVLPGCEKKTEY